MDKDPDAVLLIEVDPHDVQCIKTMLSVAGNSDPSTQFYVSTASRPRLNGSAAGIDRGYRHPSSVLDGYRRRLLDHDTRRGMNCNWHGQHLLTWR